MSKDTASKIVFMVLLLTAAIWIAGWAISHVLAIGGFLGWLFMVLVTGASHS